MRVFVCTSVSSILYSLLVPHEKVRGHYYYYCCYLGRSMILSSSKNLSRHNSVYVCKLYWM